MICPKTFKDVSTFTVVISRDGYSLTIPFLYFCSFYSKLGYMAKQMKKDSGGNSCGKISFLKMLHNLDF